MGAVPVGIFIHRPVTVPHLHTRTVGVGGRGHLLGLVQSAFVFTKVNRFSREYFPEKCTGTSLDGLKMQFQISWN